MSSAPPVRPRPLILTSLNCISGSLNPPTPSVAQPPRVVVAIAAISSFLRIISPCPPRSRLGYRRLFRLQPGSSARSTTPGASQRPSRIRKDPVHRIQVTEESPANTLAGCMPRGSHAHIGTPPYNPVPASGQVEGCESGAGSVPCFNGLPINHH